MKNLCKGVLVALTISMCGLVAAPKASADTIITTDYTSPAIVDYSTLSSPVILSEPSVIETTPVAAPTILTSPSVIESSPVMWRGDYDRHLLHVGLPGLFNFNLF